jgi:hypothetical protein
MTATFKIIDYIKVYQERATIDGVLYPRCIVHDGKLVGIPNGVSFYRKNENAKYVRLTSTKTVNGMLIRYHDKESQLEALFKLIKIKLIQKDTRVTTELRYNKRSASKTGINLGLPSGVCLMKRNRNGYEHYRIIVSVLDKETMKFKAHHIHVGKTGDDAKLQECIKKAIELRNASIDFANAALLQKTPKTIK